MTTARDLNVYDLQSKYHGSINAVYGELQQLNLDQPADAYVKAKGRLQGFGNRNRKVLTFDEAGRITRLLLPLIGKPTYYMEGVVVRGKHNYQTGWEDRERALYVTWRSLPLQKRLEIAELLENEGIDFDASYKGVLGIYYPDKTPPSCFYTSDLPAVWERKREQKIENQKVQKVVKRLDRR